MRRVLEGTIMKDREFDDDEIDYLRSLPAVNSVGRNRIRYTDQFREYCMQRYRAGDSPTGIFRDVGLDPSLIGYKRIERCMSRWRRKYEGLDLTELDVRGTSLKRRGRSGAKTEPAGGLRELRASLDELKDLIAGLRSDLESMEAAINEKGGRA